MKSSMKLSLARASAVERTDRLPSFLALISVSPAPFFYQGRHYEACSRGSHGQDEVALRVCPRLGEWATHRVSHCAAYHAGVQSVVLIAHHCLRHRAVRYVILGRTLLSMILGRLTHGLAYCCNVSLWTCSTESRQQSRRGHPHRTCRSFGKGCHHPPGTMYV